MPILLSDDDTKYYDPQDGRGCIYGFGIAMVISLVFWWAVFNFFLGN